jgi:hypothetical protein
VRQWLYRLRVGLAFPLGGGVIIDPMPEASLEYTLTDTDGQIVGGRNVPVTTAAKNQWAHYALPEQVLRQVGTLTVRHFMNRVLPALLALRSEVEIDLRNGATPAHADFNPGSGPFKKAVTIFSQPLRP